MKKDNPLESKLPVLLFLVLLQFLPSFIVDRATEGAPMQPPVLSLEVEETP